ncbi:MAG: hypothetical protein LBR19_08635 [Bifidobacteriaceae bacterium]|jgi:hypothetical protein|nr:hypothetical protein [Bifidobacteriaceae bacterium]
MSVNDQTYRPDGANRTAPRRLAHEAAVWLGLGPLPAADADQAPIVVPAPRRGAWAGCRRKLGVQRAYR